jgi:NADPH:quinone reductase-like Zn-dependent oxidoreductase
MARIPDGVSYVDAGATTLAALTALQVLKGNLGTGKRVLIHAGSGGVGHFAIQIAKAMGAHVTTTTSSKNKSFVEGLGADDHIDYREVDFADMLSDMDMVFDTQGGETLEKSLRVVKRGGIVRTIAAMGIEDDLQAKADELGVDVAMHLVTSNGADMEELAGLLRAGQQAPTIDKVFPFGSLPEAHV